MIIIKLKLKNKIKNKPINKSQAQKPCNHASHTSHTKNVQMGQVCLNEPMMRLRGPRVVPNGPSVSKGYPKKQEKPKSKLGLPGVTIRDRIIPQPKFPR